MAIILVILVAFLSAFFFYHLYYKRRKFPPGPLPLPIFGNLMAIQGPHWTNEDTFLAWHRRYGPVFTFWLGHLPVVFVSDYAKMVEMFVRGGDTLAGRYVMPYEHLWRGKDVHGVLGASGDRWLEQRRFALHAFRDLGLGKNLMQQRILDELSAMFDKIDAQLGAADELNLTELMDVAVGSIINSLMFGYRYDEESESEFWELKHALDEHFNSFNDPLNVLWMNCPELLARVPPFSGRRRQVLARIKKFFDFFECRIAEHQRDLEQFGYSSDSRDYVEAFLKEMKRLEEADQGDKHYFDLFQCANMCFDLWVAGQETSTAVLSWGVAYLLNNGHCLGQLYAELDAQIGTDRLVTVADRPKLPYTCAVVNEMLRIANLFPMVGMSRLTRDTILNGKMLPKGTYVSPQLSVVLIDDSVFPDPKSFKPERFLDSEGKLLSCNEVVSFSVGKRQCLGESLARMELFLFVANIFNCYKVSPGNSTPSLARIGVGIVKCQPYTCRLEKRSNSSN